MKNWFENREYRIWLAYCLLLSLCVSCNDFFGMKESLKEIDGKRTIMEFDFDFDDYSSVDTRATSISTTRENDIKNIYVAVFENSTLGDVPDDGDDLLQFEELTLGASGKYTALLTSVGSKVSVVILGNVPADFSTVINGALSSGYTYGQWKDVTEINSYSHLLAVEKSTNSKSFSDVSVTPGVEYTSYSPVSTNKILKNGEDGILPFYRLLSLSSLSQTTINNVGTVDLIFNYARIDVVLDDLVGSSVALKEVYGLNASDTPFGPTGKDKMIFTSAVNSSMNISTPEMPSIENAPKTIQGLYIYENTGVDKTYIIVGIERNGVTTYYKLVLRYFNASNELKYGIFRGYRYKVNILKISEEGYPSVDDAINKEASNEIFYDIDVDGSVDGYVTNGQYYIAKSKSEYKAELVTNSLVLTNRSISNEYLSDYNDREWVLNADGTFSVKVGFSVGNGGVDMSMLHGSMSFPAGVTSDTLTSLSRQWWQTQGVQKISLTLPADFEEGGVIIKVGELTDTIKLRVDIVDIMNDYTNKEFVKKLTGLDETYGTVEANGLRVANCYILDPLATEEADYYIPVMERVNKFWASPDYGNNASNVLPNGWTNMSTYSVDTIYTTEEALGLVFSKAISPSGAECIKVTLPAGFKKQNILLSLKKGNEIIWSWHLWVTDYNPYLAADGTWLYSKNIAANNTVTGVVGSNSSSVHRYADEQSTLIDIQKYVSTVTLPIWNSGGIYANKYIMDRNIGATSNRFDRRGIITYQFGRKDPFPYARLDAFDQDPEGLTLGESINKPMVLGVTVSADGVGSSWCTDQSLLGSDYIWLDKRVLTSGYTNMKSIFDPSPLGWRVPVAGTWSAFTSSTTQNSASNEEFVYNNMYYPLDGVLFVQSLGYIYSGTDALVWSSSPTTGTSKTSHAYHVHYDKSLGVFEQASPWLGRWFGYSVRSVQE